TYILRRAGKPPSAPRRNGLPGNRLRRVLDYIDQHLADDIRLCTLADVACMSAHHFSGLFRQSTRLSPHRYVIGQPIERAKEMLRTSDRDMLDIALATGFSDQSHFSKTFRRITGMVPSAYRAMA